MKRKLYIIKYLLYSFVLCIFVILCSYFYIMAIKTVNFNVSKFSDYYDIDYDIKLKENDFFNDSISSKDDYMLVSNLIDNVISEFHYEISFKEQVSGNYTYYIKTSVISSNNDSTGNFWAHDYIVSDKKSFILKNSYFYEINDEIILNYDEYEEVFNKFKKLIQMDSKGELVTSLVIDGYYKPDSFHNYEYINKEISFSIPLGSDSFSINKDLLSKKSNILYLKEKVDNSRAIYLYKVFFFFNLLLALGTAVLIIYTHNQQVNDDRYNHDLTKILTKYDRIIVNLSLMPDVRDFNVIMVDSFEELLDAQREIRCPINYYSTRNKACFMLFNDNMMWMYSMRNKRK